MKIAVFGDSFSAWDEKEPHLNGYIKQIVDHYNAECINESLSGSSLMFSLEKIFRLFKTETPDVVIFTCTAVGRLYFAGDFYCSNDRKVIGFQKKPALPIIQQAADLYYRHIWSGNRENIEWNMFAQTIANFTLEYPNTKFILLPCFDNFLLTRYGNYMVMNSYLFIYSKIDTKELNLEITGQGGNRLHHLSYSQNTDLKNILINVIDNYSLNTNGNVPIPGTFDAELINL